MTRKSIPEAPMCHVDDAMVVHMFGDTPRAADKFPPLKSQREIDDEGGTPGAVALVVMFAATFAVVVLMVVGMWMLGVQP